MTTPPGAAEPDGTPPDAPGPETTEPQTTEPETTHPVATRAAQPGAVESGVWTDTGDLDADWPEPKPVRHRPLWLTAGVPVVVVLLLVALVWSVGGFEQRSNNLTQAPPGTLVETGPFEFVFTEVTAKPNYDGDGWDLVVYGSGRVTGDEALRPNTGDHGAFVARDPKSREVQVPRTPLVGEPAEPGERSEGTFLTPGLPMVPVALELEFSQAYEPTATLTFVVLGLEFRDTTLTGTGEETWTSTAEGTAFDLPVTVLPPD